VAGTNDLADASQQAADPVEHVLALDRVGLDDLELVVAQLGRLVEDLLGDGDLPDIVQHRGELELLPRLGLDSQLVSNGVHEVHDGAAVMRGVGVLVLDHVGEEHDRAAIGALQLKGGAVSLAPVPGEEYEEPHERPDRNEGERVLVGDQCDEEGDGGQGGLDAGNSEEASGHLPEWELIDQAVTNDAPREVGGHLSHEGEDVELNRVDVRHARREGCQHQHRTDGEPAVGERGHPSVAMDLGVEDVGNDADSRRQANQQQYERQGDDQQHRNENELLGDHVVAAELEAHLGDRDVDAH